MQIKEVPEDFVVEEVMQLDLCEGPYFYYLMGKKNRNTRDVIAEIRKRLGVKDAGYAGLKDKRAVTKQYISVKKEITFTLADVTFSFVGKGKDRIYLGKLDGNQFRLTLRDLEEELLPVKEIVNYYGPQRFSKNNAALGKLLIEKKYDAFCKELGLVVEKNNYISALRAFGLSTLRFYLASYQSLLWNRCAKDSTKEILPIVGFLTEGDDYEVILLEEGLTKKDFLLRSFPEIAPEGSERKRVISVKNFKTLSFEDDELFAGRKKQVVAFYLPKGAYATVVLDCMSKKDIS